MAPNSPATRRRAEAPCFAKVHERPPVAGNVIAQIELNSPPRNSTDLWLATGRDRYKKKRIAPGGARFRAAAEGAGSTQSLTPPHDILQWETAESVPGYIYRVQARSVLMLFVRV